MTSKKEKRVFFFNIEISFSIILLVGTNQNKLPKAVVSKQFRDWHFFSLSVCEMSFLTTSSDSPPPSPSPNFIFEQPRLFPLFKFEEIKQVSRRHLK